MKHTFQWLLAATFLFVVGNTYVKASNDEEVEGVPIPLITGEVLTGDDMRGVIVVPFTAYYQGGIIYISTSAEFSSITVDVVNETTGQVWNSTMDISDGMGEISIANGDSGSYSVEIITEYGECFVGDFEL
ncbi:MAG: DUF3244 domain-containing protein [Bacteroidaceae bacterium]|nr:DUF3244 domain-containing protein [Bacteroidaceae bacterium]